jgi:hypothetical protein
MRAPREPWVNPAKRARIAIVSVVAALVLLFGGLVVGFAAGHHRAERMIHTRFDQGYGDQQGPPRVYPHNLPNGGQPRRGGPDNERKIPFGPASPTPSATKTS